MSRGFLLLAGCVAWLAGCGGPEVRFLQANCQKEEREGRFAALAFDSSFEASGLRGEQLVVQVQIMNRRGRLVRSVDDRYKSANGAVAVGKTLYVQENRETFERVRLTLPAGQINLQEDDLPAQARFVVMNVDGKALATSLARVPLSRVEGDVEGSPPPPAYAPPPDSSAAEAPPPQAENPPEAPRDPEAASTPPALRRAAPPASDADKLWFLPPRHDNWPTLRGPYVSGKDLLDRAYRENLSPIPLKTDEEVWFVPVGSSRENAPRALLGPCMSQDDASTVVAAYRKLARRREADVDAGEPLRMNLAEGLAQQSAGPKDTLTQEDESAGPAPRSKPRPRPRSGSSSDPD